MKNFPAKIFHWAYCSEKELTNRLSGLSIHHDIISVSRTWRMFWKCCYIVYVEKEHG